MNSKRMKTTGEHLYQDQVTKRHKHSELRDMSQGFRSAGPRRLNKEAIRDTLLGLIVLEHMVLCATTQL